MIGLHVPLIISFFEFCKAHKIKMVVVDATNFNFWVLETAQFIVDQDISVHSLLTEPVAITRHPEEYFDCVFMDSYVRHDDDGVLFLNWYGRWFKMADVKARVVEFFTRGWYTLEKKDCVIWILDFIERGWYFNKRVLLENCVVLFLAGGDFGHRDGLIKNVVQQFIDVCDETDPVFDVASIGSIDTISLVSAFDAEPIDINFNWVNDDDIIDVWDEDLIPGLLDEDPISVIDLTFDD